MTDQLPQKAGEKRPNNHEHYKEENGGTPKKQKVDLEDGPRRMVTTQYEYCANLKLTRKTTISTCWEI